MPKYRIYCASGDRVALPSAVQVERKYPAFVIAQMAQGVAAMVGKDFPVEQIEAARYSNANALFSSDAVAPLEWGRSRPPYLLKATLKAPCQPAWKKRITELGCEISTHLGRGDIVVRCSSRNMCERLFALPFVVSVEPYEASVNLSKAFYDSLATELRTGPKRRSRRTVRERHHDQFKHHVVPGLIVVSFLTAADCRRGMSNLRLRRFRKLVPSGDCEIIVDMLGQENPSAALDHLLLLRGVRQIEEKSVPGSCLDVARERVAGHVVGTVQEGLGLTGKGEIIAIADSGLDSGQQDDLHLDLRGRVRSIQSFPISTAFSHLVDNPKGDDGAADRNSGHGTHVAGIVAGNGTAAREAGLAVKIVGMCPAAEIVFQALEQTPQWNLEGKLKFLDRGVDVPMFGLYGLPRDLRKLFSKAFEQGARIHCNAYGSGSEAKYDSRCTQLDQFVWDHQDFLPVVAAGNEGVPLAGPPHIAPMTLSSPGTAKNCLTVGAAEEERGNGFEFSGETYGGSFKAFETAPPSLRNDRISNNGDDLFAPSSRGPCQDGRRKPDLVVPGSSVLSARPARLDPNFGVPYPFEPDKKNYTYMGGTSMATGIAAGAAALVRQALRKINGRRKWSAALIKAILIHSSQYSRSYPNYRFRNPKSRPPADHEEGWGHLNLEHVFFPNPPTRVVFCDNKLGLGSGSERVFPFDVHGARPLRLTLVYTDRPGPQLVNNLQLQAWAPNGKYHLGNDFDRQGIPDSVNNVEGILLKRPRKGAWVAKVVGVAVDLRAPQRFALVISGDSVSGRDLVRLKLP